MVCFGAQSGICVHLSRVIARPHSQPLTAVQVIWLSPYSFYHNFLAFFHVFTQKPTNFAACYLCRFNCTIYWNGISSVKRPILRSRPKYSSLSPLSPELDQGQVSGIFQVQKVQHPSMKGSLGRTFQTGAPVGMCANKEKPCGGH